MAKRLTPIEQAIAGPPLDRRRRHDAKMASLGFKRVVVNLPREDAELVRKLAKKLREDPSALAELKDLLDRVGDDNSLRAARTERSDGVRRQRSSSDLSTDMQGQ
jgi:hypothetical protein